MKQRETYLNLLSEPCHEGSHSERIASLWAELTGTSRAAVFPQGRALEVSELAPPTDSLGIFVRD